MTHAFDLTARTFDAAQPEQTVGSKSLSVSSRKRVLPGSSSSSIDSGFQEPWYFDTNPQRDVFCLSRVRPSPSERPNPTNRLKIGLWHRVSSRPRSMPAPNRSVGASLAPTESAMTQSRHAPSSPIRALTSAIFSWRVFAGTPARGKPCLPKGRGPTPVPYASTPALIQSGIASHWSLEKIFEELTPRLDGIPKPAASLAGVAQRLNTDPCVNDLVAAIDGQRTLGEILAEVARSPLTVATIWLLEASELIHFAPAQPQSEPTPADSSRQFPRAAKPSVATPGATPALTNGKILRDEILERLAKPASKDPYTILGAPARPAPQKSGARTFWLPSATTRTPSGASVWKRFARKPLNYFPK